jgi:DNA (cytosine-5)-methyltransferase 3A
MIDSALVAPAMRKRYYWTNIPDVVPPKKKDVPFQSILDEGYTERKKARCLAVIDSRPNTTPVKMFHRFYSSGFTTLIFKDR